MGQPLARHRVTTRRRSLRACASRAASRGIQECTARYFAAVRVYDDARHFRERARYGLLHAPRRQAAAQMFRALRRQRLITPLHGVGHRGSISASCAIFGAAPMLDATRRSYYTIASFFSLRHISPIFSRFSSRHENGALAAGPRVSRASSHGCEISLLREGGASQP